MSSQPAQFSIPDDRINVGRSLFGKVLVLVLALVGGPLLLVAGGRLLVRRAS